MRIFHYQDVEARNAEEDVSKLRVRWLMMKEIGAENFAMRLFEIEAGGSSPFHSHAWEREVFILECDGLAVGEGGQREFRAGDVIFILPNEKHQLKNYGEKTVKFLCLVAYPDEYVRVHQR